MDEQNLSEPLVSCIMPTYNRRKFVPHAIRYFQIQDYPNKELVIIDDGTESVVDLVPNDPQMYYVRCKKQGTLGDKRNHCVMASHGDLIMHWDDDDWMAPNRISYQTKALLQEEAEICGLQRMLFFEPASNQVWLYEYPDDQRPWLAGNSLLYTREFWQQSPFPSVQIASDTLFVWNHQMDRRAALSDYSFYVALIHPYNTSPKRYDGSYWKQWKGDLKNIMGEDLQYYQVQQKTNVKAIITNSATIPPKELQNTVDSQLNESVSKKISRLPDTINSYNKYLGIQDIETTYMNNNSLVSCILVTQNSQIFLRQAIRCFLRQTYEHSELIVVDDDKHSAKELCSGLYRVRHIRLEKPTSFLNKLNIGIRHAQGSICQIFDDSGYYHPNFIEKAVKALPKKDRELTLVALDSFLILITGEKNVHYSGHGLIAKGTLCFHRELWDQIKFHDYMENFDTAFIKDETLNIVRICESELYIQFINNCNTSSNILKRNENGLFRKLPIYHKLLDELILPLDRVFYKFLSEGVS